MAAKTINMATAARVTHTHTQRKTATTTTLQNGNETNNKQNQITIRNSIECAKRDTHGYCLCPRRPFPITSIR